MPSKVYRLICILDSVRDGNNTPSSIDVSPDYLHIHILKSDYLAPLSEFSNSLSEEREDHILYQWGIISEKELKNRYAKVSAKEISQKGNIGIGSTARGIESTKTTKQEGDKDIDFIGGGEGFLSGSQNFRITKGNKIFEADRDQNYWTFQTTDFSNASSYDDLRDILINGRDNLERVLKDKSGGKPFVATFDAEFCGSFFARSNGIFPEDLQYVSNPNQVLFDEEIEGGHLLGGSNNSGDIESVRNLGAQISGNDFSCKIVSSVMLKPIDEVRVVKKDGSFRNPRTEIEVSRATQLIERIWNKYKEKQKWQK